MSRNNFNSRLAKFKSRIEKLFSDEASFKEVKLTMVVEREAF